MTKRNLRQLAWKSAKPIGFIVTSYYTWWMMKGEGMNLSLALPGILAKCPHTKLKFPWKKNWFYRWICIGFQNDWSHSSLVDNEEQTKREEKTEEEEKVLLLTLQICFQLFIRIVVFAESNSTHAQYVVLHRYFSHPKLTVQCTGGVALTLFTQLLHMQTFPSDVLN